MLHNPEFWILVAFVIFVAGIFKPARQRILAALDARAERIKADLDEAQRLREEAQGTLAAYQRKQRQAVKEADEILTHAQEEAELFRDRAAEDLEAALSRREKMAVDRIAQAEADAVQEVRKIAAEVAVAATRELVSERLDKAKADALIKDAAKELPKKLH
jgi:F-type H+-transporting ATPase subunit b